MKKHRKIFLTVASGGHDTDKHYFDTIKTKHTVQKIRSFLSSEEAEELKDYVHDNPFAVWGAVPGPSNSRTWEVMEPGDYIMVYRGGRIIAAAEVAHKTKNPNLARYFWQEDRKGNTWELIYFLTNEVETNVKQPDLNQYLGYNESYFPRGFMAIDQEKTDKLLTTYGDLLSLLQKLETGEKLEEVDIEKKSQFQEIIEDRIGRAPTDHDEIQWRLISLGNKAKLDVWVPPADQGKKYEKYTFRDHVIKEFHEALDIPSYIKNIDAVWKLGLSVKAAFEIENTTSIYSGILRLSDLRALAPNSNYPLFIVADRDKKSRVFEQLKRPTFSNDYLNLDRAVKFLSYDAIRDLDLSQKVEDQIFEVGGIIKMAESAN